MYNIYLFLNFLLISNKLWLSYFPFYLISIVRIFIFFPIKIFHGKGRSCLRARIRVSETFSMEAGAQEPLLCWTSSFAGSRAEMRQKGWMHPLGWGPGQGWGPAD